MSKDNCDKLEEMQEYHRAMMERPDSELLREVSIRPNEEYASGWGKKKIVIYARGYHAGACDTIDLVRQLPQPEDRSLEEKAPAEAPPRNSVDHAPGRA